MKNERVKLFHELSEKYQGQEGVLEALATALEVGTMGDTANSLALYIVWGAWTSGKYDALLLWCRLMKLELWEIDEIAAEAKIEIAGETLAERVTALVKVAVEKGKVGVVNKLV